MGSSGQQVLLPLRPHVDPAVQFNNLNTRSGANRDSQEKRTANHRPKPLRQLTHLPLP